MPVCPLSTGGLVLCCVSWIGIQKYARKKIGCEQDWYTVATARFCVFSNQDNSNKMIKLVSFYTIAYHFHCYYYRCYCYNKYDYFVPTVVKIAINISYHNQCNPNQSCYNHYFYPYNFIHYHYQSHSHHYHFSAKAHPWSEDPSVLQRKAFVVVFNCNHVWLLHHRVYLWSNNVQDTLTRRYCLLSLQSVLVWLIWLPN